MSEQWYRVALVDGDRTRVAIAPGEQLGDAIRLALARAGRKDAWPFAVEPAEARDVPLGESVGKGVVVERGEAPAGVTPFRWPSGVLPTLAGARALGRVSVGHARSRHGETEVVEAVVAGDQLVETFHQLVELLPSADNIEVRVMDHYDQGSETEVWLTPRLADVRKVTRFLDDHDVELLGNGHVEVSVYLRKERSTLRLTEHKTIVWLTEDPALADRFAGWLVERDLPAVEPLALVASVDHYHWRPPSTRSRKKLTQYLHRMRLRCVDTLSS